MILVGIFQVIQGLVAIFNDDWYLVSNRGLVLSVDYSVWGWIHLVLGLVIATAGVAAINGKTWNLPAVRGSRLYVRNGQEAACYDLGPVETALKDSAANR